MIDVSPSSGPTPSIDTGCMTWLPIIFMGLLVGSCCSTLRARCRDQAAADQGPATTPTIGWEDIAGADEAKDELQEVVEFLRDPERFQQARRDASRAGSCSTGRRARARRCWPRPSPTSRAPSSSPSRPPRSSRCSPASAPRASGGSSREARKHAPGHHLHRRARRRRRPARHGHLRARRTRRSTSCSSRWTASTAASNVVVIAASNLLEKLDPALLRPGRFDRQIFVSPARRRRPRAGSSSVHTKGKPLAPSVDLDLIARQTSGLSGADLANICNEAAIFCARRDGRDDRHGGLRRRARARRRRHAVAPHAQRRTSAASSPSTRPATRCAPSCCRASTRSTRSRSSRAAGRWATR